MKTEKQNADFLHIGKKIAAWYQDFGRDLSFRKTSNPYHIWICEIIFQQTRINQGLAHYNNFIQKFPTVQQLAAATTDEVMLSWKGLGYYSRALNLHTASQQVVTEYGGKFPEKFEEILRLKGVGKYTAAAISSICFGKRIPAVDGNFYRVLSRIFADALDISSSRAFAHFTELALQMMPHENPAHFNQGMMDLGSEICRPKNPACERCPVNSDCRAYQSGTVSLFPVKIRKTKVENLELTYYFVKHGNRFLISKRNADFIWKNLYEFPQNIDEDLIEKIADSETVKHKLTHRNLTIQFHTLHVANKNIFENFAAANAFNISDYEASKNKSFPKPLQKFLERKAREAGKQMVE